jgi:integral membrane sensor domain MASE1
VQVGSVARVLALLPLCIAFCTQHITQYTTTGFFLNPSLPLPRTLTLVLLLLLVAPHIDVQATKRRKIKSTR